MAEEKAKISLFREKANNYQRDQHRTKETALKFSLSIFGIGIVVFFVCLILNYVFIEKCQVGLCILIVGMILGGIMIPVGLIWTIVNFVRPTKTVVCPNCNAEHRIYKSVRKYMCPTCRSLILMSSDTQFLPQMSGCPYCGLQTAVSQDHGSYLCPNCGIVLESAGAQSIGKTKACPECNSSVPLEAIYCKSCGYILNCDFTKPAKEEPKLTYDDDWLIGKDETGHFYYAKALLQSIRKKVREASSVDDIHVMISQLEGAFVSIEEALSKSGLRTSIEDLLPEIDLLYANLLEVELQIVQTLKLRKRYTKKQIKEALKEMAIEPHIKARRRVEDILAGALDSAGSIGKWKENLLDIKTDDKYSQIQGYQALQEEMERFKKWKAERDKKIE